MEELWKEEMEVETGHALPLRQIERSGSGRRLANPRV